MRKEVCALRRTSAFGALAGCFRAARDRFGVRIVEFSVQGNHIHLILEADDNEALTRAMRGLTIRIAKALNALMRRHGKVLGDTYHSRLLRTPTELANAIGYVLNNAKHHFGERDTDVYSSLRTDRHELVAEPRGWLLTVGWRRAKRRQAVPNQAVPK